MFIGLIDSLFSSSDEEDISSMYSSLFPLSSLLFLVVWHSCLYCFISFIFHSPGSQGLLWSVNLACESTCLSLSCPLLSFPIGLRASLPLGLNGSTSFLFTGNIDISSRDLMSYRFLRFVTRRVFTRINYSITSIPSIRVTAAISMIPGRIYRTRGGPVTDPSLVVFPVVL